MSDFEPGLATALEDVYRGHPRDEWQSLAHRLAAAAEAATARMKAEREVLEAQIVAVRAALMQGGQSDRIRWEAAVRALESDVKAPEVEYEYGFRDEHNVPYPVRFDSQQEAQDWLDFSKRKAEDFRMMRRRKAGPWEDVK